MGAPHRRRAGRTHPTRSVTCCTGSSPDTVSPQRQCCWPRKLHERGHPLAGPAGPRSVGSSDGSGSLAGLPSVVGEVTDPGAAPLALTSVDVRSVLMGI